MVYIYVSGRGCSTGSLQSTKFKCSMCHPWQAKLDQKVYDNACACAKARIERGVIYQYHEPIIEKDKRGKDVITGYNFVEKYKED